MPITAAPHRTLRVAASGTALVLATFSAFVVNAGDSARALHASPAASTWALSAMSFGLAVALLAAGAIADDRGHSRVLAWSAALLALSSVAGAVAPDTALLVGARVLQGVAGGGVLAAGLGAIGQAFPAGAARGRATAVWGAAVGGGIAAGPVAGAALAAAFGWRGGFWFEALGAAALVYAASGLPEARPPRRRPLDVGGAATLAGAMGLLVAALVESRQPGAAGTTLALAAGAAALLAAFALVERRRRRPLVEPALFAEPRFRASVLGALFTGLAVVGLMSFIPALLQGPLHLSALATAGLLAAWSGTSMLVAFASRSLPARLPSRGRVVVGLALTAAGELALTGLAGGASWTRLLPGLFVAGVGSGIANAALARIAVESVPPERAGMGSGANNTARYLGGAAGVALVVSIASGPGADHLVQGWNTAALVSAALCALGALAVAACRPRS